MNLSPLPIQRFYDANNRPLVGGQLFTYVASTTTKIDTYTDYTGVQTNTNPIVLDFRGECRLWLNPALAYKFVLSPASDTDPPTNPIWTVDHVTVGPASADNAADDTGTANNVTLNIAAVTALAPFLRVVFRATAPNTGPTLLTVNGLPAKQLNLQNGFPFSGGELQTGGIYEAIYDGLQWQLMSPALTPLQQLDITETATGSVPGAFWFSRTPTVDIRRWGDSTNKWDDSTNDTVATNKAIAYAKSIKGTVIIPNNVIASVDTLTNIVFGGTIFDSGLRIEGTGKGSVLKQRNTTANILSVSGLTPTSNPNDGPTVLEGFVLEGLSGSTGTGIKFDGLAGWTLRGMLIHSFATDVNMLSSLVGTIDECSFYTASGFGLIFNRDGAGSGCNNITVINSKFVLCGTNGLYVNSGDIINFIGCQFEASGTAANMTTGNVRVASGFGAEIGSGVVNFIGCRWEGSLGENMLIDVNAAARVNVVGGLALNGVDTTRVINDLGCAGLSVRGLNTGASSVIKTAAATFTAADNTVGSFSDTSPLPVYLNNTTGAGFLAFGKPVSFTGTLTQVTGTVTSTFNATKQGGRVWLRGSLVGASPNTNSPTVLGMPVELRPSVARTVQCVVQDNSVAKSAYVSIATSGVMTINNGYTGAAFTAAGNKGIDSMDVCYEL